MMDVQTQRTIAIVFILLAICVTYWYALHDRQREMRAVEEDKKILREELRKEMRRSRPMTTSTKRAREWLASARPLLTWAPLVHAGALARHAWPLPSGEEARIPPTHTACGIEAVCPTSYSDDGRTPDCEVCRDAAAAPLAALLDEVCAAEHYDLVRFITAYESLRHRFGDEYAGRFAECDEMVKLYDADKPLAGA